MNYRGHCFAALVVTLQLSAAATVAARHQPADDDAAELSAALMSPFCPGLLLASCPSSAAQALRREILRRLENGESRASIEHDLIVRYGEAILGAPRAGGVGVVAWGLPAMFGALTLTLAGVAVRRALSRSRQAEPLASAHDAAFAARLDAEPHALDGERESQRRWSH